MKVVRVFIPLLAAAQLEYHERPRVQYIAYSPSHGWSRWGNTPQEATRALQRAIAGNKSTGLRTSRRRSG